MGNCLYDMQFYMGNGADEAIVGYYSYFKEGKNSQDFDHYLPV